MRVIIFLVKYNSANSLKKNSFETKFSYAILNFLSKNKIRNINLRIRLETIAKESDSLNNKTETKRLLTEMLKSEHKKLIKNIRNYLIAFLNE